MKPELGQLLRRLGADFASGPERLANTAAAIRALAAAAAAAAAGRSVGVSRGQRPVGPCLDLKYLVLWESSRKGRNWLLVLLGRTKSRQVGESWMKH